MQIHWKKIDLYLHKLYYYNLKYNTMDNFNYLIINFIDNNKWINKFDSYFTRNPEFIITNNHLDYFINKKIKPQTLNKILLKFINFGYIPSNEQIITILQKIQLQNDIEYFIRILLKTMKNKKIIFNDNTFNIISNNIKILNNYNYYIWRIIHEKRYIITNNNIFKQIYYTDNYVMVQTEYKLIKYKYYDISYNDLINYITNKYKIYPNNDTLLYACRTGNAVLYNHAIKYNNILSIDCIIQMYDLHDFSKNFIKYIIFDIIDHKIIISNDHLNYFLNNNKRIYDLIYEQLYW
jgi:hypothetical protein